MRELALYYANNENKKEVRIKENVFQTLVSLIGEGKTTSSSLLIYSALKRYDIVGLHSVFPSYDTLAQETNLSKGTISNTIKSLIENGVLLTFKIKSGTKTMIKYYFPLEYDLTTKEGKNEFAEVVKKDINNSTILVLTQYLETYVVKAQELKKEEKLEGNIDVTEAFNKFTELMCLEKPQLPF